MMPTYSDSGLIEVVDLSPYSYNRKISSNPNGIIDKITIHHAAGVSSAEDILGIFHAKAASANYVIGNDGKIGLSVHESNRAITSCSSANDSRAVTIEVSNSKFGGDWPVSSAAYESLIKLCTDICKRNKIKALNFTGTAEGNLTMHCYFAATACPGPYLKARFPDIALRVNRNLGYDNTVIPPYSGSLTGVTESPPYYASTTGKLQIDTTQITPYVITIDRHTKFVNWDKLKDNGVIGVNIEGGCLFDFAHKVVKFRSPKLMSQVEQCMKSGLPYSIYFESRANSVQEALNELYEIQLVLATYTPGLGVWLVTHFGPNKTKNNAILDIFYEYFVQFGFKDKMGLYVKSDQLQLIDWTKHSENWYLWLDSHIPSMSNLGELMVPQFFVPEGVGST